MRIDPFDPELLSAYQHVARLYPGLDLDGFRVLWDEAGAFMDEALAHGYEPHEVPALYTTRQPPGIGLKRPRPENGRPGLENGSRELQNTPRGIILAFPGITAKCPAAEKSRPGITGEPQEPIFTTPKPV